MNECMNERMYEGVKERMIPGMHCCVHVSMCIAVACCCVSVPQDSTNTCLYEQMKKRTLNTLLLLHTCKLRRHAAQNTYVFLHVRSGAPTTQKKELKRRSRGAIESSRKRKSFFPHSFCRSGWFKALGKNWSWSGL